MPLTESDKAVLTKYPIAPSKCVVCLRSSNGELNFIDFQMSLDIYGSVNICVDCLAPIAQLLGFVEKGLLNDADEQIRNLVESNRKLIAENEQLHAVIAALAVVRPDLELRDLPVDESPSESPESDDRQLELELEVKGSDNRKSSKSNASGRLEDIIKSATDFDI